LLSKLYPATCCQFSTGSGMVVINGIDVMRDFNRVDFPLPILP